MPAKEIRAVEPDAIAAFLHRSDNSIDIGSGQSAQISTGASGDVTTANACGRELEIVTTHDTRIYRDLTAHQIALLPPPSQKEKRRCFIPFARA